MAVRLPVVLCQHPRRSGTHSEHEEAWITRLLFEERLDATLVADLATIPLNSTDQLCLEGFKGGFLLLSWQSAESVAEHLQRLGIAPADLVPVRGGPKIPVTHSAGHSELANPMPLAASPLVDKRIYYLHLDLGRSVDAGIRELKTLLLSLSTPVFQLQSLAPSARGTGSARGAELARGTEPARGAELAKSKSPEPPSPNLGVSAPEVPRSALTLPSGVDQIPPGSHARSEPGRMSSLEKTRPMDSNMDDEFPNIDSLVQELDDLDL